MLRDYRPGIYRRRRRGILCTHVPWRAAGRVLSPEDSRRASHGIGQRTAGERCAGAEDPRSGSRAAEEAELAWRGDGGVPAASQRGSSVSRSQWTLLEFLAPGMLCGRRFSCHADQDRRAWRREALPGLQKGRALPLAARGLPAPSGSVARCAQWLSRQVSGEDLDITLGDDSGRWHVSRQLHVERSTAGARRLVESVAAGVEVGLQGKGSCSRALFTFIALTLTASSHWLSCATCFAAKVAHLCA